MELSIVSPVFNEAGNVSELVSSVIEVIKQLPASYQFELVLVDDGSTDGSWEQICNASNIKCENFRIKGVKLVSNFGQMAALDAGIMQSSGKFVLTMDSDLQHPPSLIPKFFELRETAVVIAGRQIQRSEKVLKKVLSSAFYRFLRRVSGLRIESNVGDFRLMPRSIATKLIRDTENGQVLRFTIARLNLKTEYVDFEANPRKWGATSYSVGKMVNLAVKSLITTTTKPLKISLYMAFFFSVTFIFNLVYTIIEFLYDKTITGWTSIVAFISLGFFGLFLSVAVMSTYLGQIVEYARKSPRYIYEEIK
jgi:polyisoprenyl-phosphate glycosyltransferase